MHECLVRMAVDDDVARITREQFLGRRAAQFVSMGHVDGQSAPPSNVFRLERRARWIDIAVDGSDRSDGAEFVEDPTPAESPAWRI